MAAVKENVKVLAGTFPVASGDRASRMLSKLKNAGLEGFEVKPWKEMPEYIQVIAECKDKGAAEDLIKQGREKRINLCMA